ncbi:DUF4350 domain-containing protein [Pseudomonas hefeiensis]|uniref:DUF4350 domain-containing protein n=1 Tax=Pseudomonas hefeiensis TaxID=2738125 RepID=A0ABY9GDY4_9PSED|nr:MULTISPECIES: DUF4350 domain-containing protein [unclassified Pseudomonas]WLH13860.1 DUF4350 domain-containing protein [Pseudomonas sp. FP205]WLH96912.1 DUF4350 domain-containing protein [Pseudomonas sp. FP53]WLI41189.1 DUF4350 domain-containing protein [Pseudomonas sp. FP821]
MNRRAGLLIGAGVAALLCALGLYLFLKAVPYQETIDHGPSPEAQANPYLAAEHFLRRQGINVEHANNLDVLPSLEPDQRSLLLLGERTHMTPWEVDQLMNWAQAGGRLLFVAEALWDNSTASSGDLLLDRVRLRQFLSKDLKAPEPELIKDSYPKLTKLYLEDEEAPAYVGFDTDFHLEDPQNLAQAWANSALATHMMQLNHGLGSITVLTDAELWKNDHIDQYDNAWLLWYLSADTQVTLLYDIDHDNLLALLLRYFPQASVALLALIALWLWRSAMRQGPLQQPAAKARRQLEEHLQASAAFHLRHNGRQHLLHSLQQDVLRRARHLHPGFEQQAVAEQWQVLARLTRQPTRAISQAFSPRPQQRMSSAEFCRQVAHLQTLRNAL